MLPQRADPMHGIGSVALGPGFEQLDVGNRGDRVDDVLGPGGRAEAELELDLVAALRDPLAVDPGELDAARGEEARDVADGFEAADLEPELDQLRAGLVEPRDQ